MGFFEIIAVGQSIMIKSAVPFIFSLFHCCFVCYSFCGLRFENLTDKSYLHLCMCGLFSDLISDILFFFFLAFFHYCLREEGGGGGGYNYGKTTAMFA